MRQINFRIILLCFSLILLSIGNRCNNPVPTPTNPSYINPYDPQNPESHGNPFQLTAIPTRWDVNLTWKQPVNGAQSGYFIYRSKESDGLYKKLNASSWKIQSLGYIDEDIERGQSYWYKISAARSEGVETSLSVVDAVRVNISKLDIGTLTDIDGNTYQTVRIGSQWWMAENLKVIHFRNGDAVPQVTDYTTWGGLKSGAYCNYGNNESNVANYGRLYNWFVVNDYRQIAPIGWHVPTNEDWKTLESYLGSGASHPITYNYGGKLKAMGTSHWMSPNTGANNMSGFTAMPGGFRGGNGVYNYLGGQARFWTSTESSSRLIDYNSTDMGTQTYDSKILGYSLRCIMD